MQSRRRRVRRAPPRPRAAPPHRGAAPPPAPGRCARSSTRGSRGTPVPAGPRCSVTHHQHIARRPLDVRQRVRPVVASPDDAPSVRGTTGSPATCSRTRRWALSTYSTHSSTTASSMCGPVAIVRGGAGRTANEATRRTAPTRTARPAAATTRSADSASPPNAAVSRRDDGSGVRARTREAPVRPARAGDAACRARLPRLTRPGGRAPPTSRPPAPTPRRPPRSVPRDRTGVHRPGRHRDVRGKLGPRLVQRRRGGPLR